MTRRRRLRFRWRRILAIILGLLLAYRGRWHLAGLGIFLLGLAADEWQRRRRT